MQQEIRRRQSRRGLGLGAELGGLGEGAAADAAAMDAAGNDTEEEKQNDDLPPLEDLDEDPHILTGYSRTQDIVNVLFIAAIILIGAGSYVKQRGGLAALPSG